MDRRRGRLRDAGWNEFFNNSFINILLIFLTFTNLLCVTLYTFYSLTTTQPAICQSFVLSLETEGIMNHSGMFICVTLLTLYFMEPQSGQLQVIGSEAPLDAVAGEDLVLPCFIKPNTSAVDMTVEWFKLDVKDSLVHLYRDHEDKNEDQAQSYRGRTSLFKEELQKGNTSLKLSALRVSDEGEYKCLVEDKPWYDDITVKVIVEAQGSHPVIMMESFDNSGGINLVCESRGWNPEPYVLWLDREGVTLTAEDTQIHRDTEGFNVKSRITVYNYSDSNRFYCRLQQQHYMLETEIIISSGVFGVWKWAVSISVVACLFLVGLILTVFFGYKKVLVKARSGRLCKIFERLRRMMVRTVKNSLQTTSKDLQHQLAADVRNLLNAYKQKINEFAVLTPYRRTMSHKRKQNLVILAHENTGEKKKNMDVTLDPDSAHPQLTVSADGKRVTHVDTPQTDSPQRFKFSCVLGKQSFSSGRFYYEVQVRRKTDWKLGVVKENINRKGWITRCPQNGFWTVVLRNNNQYEARADPAVSLELREKLEVVGVFVDYEEGLVSFYDVKSRSHIYSFTGQSFTEKLYPYFSPCDNKGGKNSAPLIITAVNE
ncbi:hypothetical protein Q7C36_004424 [Tachysurus vachellii]|uniref:Butyrophilin subfamily 1 member A1-like n=1 Tax=Tachysurus vachellii TaxID=175792 RepID=A0AA88NPX7_TACVA|nr:hypothetical protein Q7C36_004424 [Tachysurus vachellii]